MIVRQAVPFGSAARARPQPQSRRGAFALEPVEALPRLSERIGRLAERALEPNPFFLPEFLEPAIQGARPQEAAAGDIFRPRRAAFLRAGAGHRRRPSQRPEAQRVDASLRAARLAADRPGHAGPGGGRPDRAHAHQRPHRARRCPTCRWRDRPRRRSPAAARTAGLLDRRRAARCGRSSIRRRPTGWHISTAW